MVKIKKLKKLWRNKKKLTGRVDRIWGNVSREREISVNPTDKNNVPYKFKYVSDEEAEEIKKRAKSNAVGVKPVEASKEDLDKIVKKKARVILNRKKSK